MKPYNCGTCQGHSPCCWENPATYAKVAENERRVGWIGVVTTVPADVARAWRWRWWPLHLTRQGASLTLSWGTLAGRHRGYTP